MAVEFERRGGKMKYYIKCKGRTFGPTEENKIKHYVASGFFSLNSVVSTDLKNWLPLQDCISISEDIIIQPTPALVGDDNNDSPQVFRLSESNVVNKKTRIKNTFDLSFLRRKSVVLGTCSLVIVALLGVGGYFFLQSDTVKNKKSATKSPEGFQQVCQKHQSAVGVVTVTLEDSNGKLLSGVGDFKLSPDHPIGTAFAIGKNQFATNCHVAYGVKDQKAGVLENILEKIVVADAQRSGVKNRQQFEQYLKENKKNIEDFRAYLHNNVRVRNVEIRLAHSGGRSLSVSEVQIHPRYQANPEPGREFKNGEFDVAILTTTEDVNNYFPVASKEKLHALAPGQEIAYIGFPMEGLADNGNIDLDRPEAVFKQGTINKITDFNNVFSTPEFNKSIIHDIPAAGGASGSPIFLANGEVVAILWGVTHTGMNERGRVASAVQHNMAVRIDSLDIVKKQKTHDIKEWLGEKK